MSQSPYKKIERHLPEVLREIRDARRDESLSRLNRLLGHALGHVLTAGSFCLEAETFPLFKAFAVAEAQKEKGFFEEASNGAISSDEVVPSLEEALTEENLARSCAMLSAFLISIDISLSESRGREASC